VTGDAQITRMRLRNTTLTLTHVVVSDLVRRVGICMHRTTTLTQGYRLMYTSYVEEQSSTDRTGEVGETNHSQGCHPA